MTQTNEGYAQNDEHLRNMEKEAYLDGNMNFRDWEDEFKKGDRIKMKLEEQSLISQKDTSKDISTPEKFAQFWIAQAKSNFINDAEEYILEQGLQAYSKNPQLFLRFSNEYQRLSGKPFSVSSNPFSLNRSDKFAQMKQKITSAISTNQQTNTQFANKQQLAPQTTVSANKQTSEPESPSSHINQTDFMSGLKKPQLPTNSPLNSTNKQVQPLTSPLVQKIRHLLNQWNPELKLPKGTTLGPKTFAAMNLVKKQMGEQPYQTRKQAFKDLKNFLNWMNPSQQAQDSQRTYSKQDVDQDPGYQQFDEGTKYMGIKVNPLITERAELLQKKVWARLIEGKQNVWEDDEEENEVCPECGKDPCECDKE